MVKKLLSASNRLFIVDRVQRRGPAAFGRKILLESLAERGIEVEIAGYRAAGGEGSAWLHVGGREDILTRRLLESNGLLPRAEAEAVVIAWCTSGAGGRVLVVSGGGERGLMYALLEAAERIASGGLEALAAGREGIAYPANRVRGVYQFLMGPLDRAWYDSVEYWRYYFARLARSRFNRFLLVMGFDTGYLSPPYPFFVQADAYPEVRVADLSARDRQANLEHLRRVIALAHEHGIEFVLGSWQQKPWVNEEELLVENLPRDEAGLADYCAEGLKALLRELPELDGIHFRVNHEAGVGNQRSNRAFWRRMVGAVAEVRRDIALDIRAKGLTDRMIADALETGLSLTVPTKYWCEHAGLPYHLTQMRREELSQLDNFNHSRRYSYADMLTRPRGYDLVYRLWNNGTTSFLLWSDPDYVRRFIASCRLGDAAGYEVAAPLALRWGHSALQKEPWPLFDDPALRTGRWDDERYWLFYLLFGRLGYDPEEGDELWRREMARRYPRDAILSLEAAHTASGKILPLITAFHMPVHPQLSYWPEVSTGGALFVENNHRPYRYMGREVSYGAAEPSDPGLFYGIDDYVDDARSGGLAPRYTPLQVADWLAACAGATRQAVKGLDAAAGIEGAAGYPSTRLDFLLLADLADYHAEKVRAAVALAEYERSGETADLEASFGAMNRALGAWRALAERGNGSYHENLVFQAGSLEGGRMGHWRDFLPELEADLARLEALRGGEPGAATGHSSRSLIDIPAEAPATGGLDTVSALVPEEWEHGRELTVELLLDALGGERGSWNLHYRHANQLEGAFERKVMEATQRGFRATIPASYLAPQWDLLLYFSTVVSKRETRIYPGLYNAEHPLPYLVVRIR